MLTLLSRMLKLLPGFLLIAIVIWVAGPYLEVSGRHPLDPESARMLAIAAVVLLWLVWIVIERLRARQASAKLAAAVVSQPLTAEPAPSADVLRLREGFDQAIGTLGRRGRASSLYDLPWYVFIGPPGSGKTTALLNSGLHFASDPGEGHSRLRGVGGTRNCEWWFTDEAVFLDTAGRFTTQDSDAASDSAAWREFLTLLAQHRRRRPINGVILTVSARDLLTLGEAGREGQMEAARHRLRELVRDLGIELPVYVMVTMCDLVAGFTEYFDDLRQAGRADVWGVTFPYEATRSGTAARAFPGEFDALIARLNERLFGRLDEEIDAGRRARIFAFPQQMAALREPLTQWLAGVFTGTTYDRPVLLRGVYLTSGTQEGTPIDRLLGAIGRGFRLAPETVAPAGRGKAYFVERLLKEVLIGESGLAGVNRTLEFRKAMAQLGAYAGLVFLGAVGLTLLSVSYARNRDYVDDVSKDVARLGDAPATRDGRDRSGLVARLDAVKAVADSANRYERDIPWAMRWGLYQGRSLGTSAQDAYLRELDSTLLPFVAERFRSRIDEYRGRPEELYDYLKAYLMLGRPEHLDKQYLKFLASLEWTDVDGSASVARHFDALLDRDEPLRPMPLDDTLVQRACRTIEQVSIGRIMYSWLRQTYTSNDTHQVRLDVVGGVGPDGVLRRRSGASLSDPVPGLFSRTVFEEVTGKAMPELVDQFADDQWVCGARAIGDRRALESELVGIYQQEYITTWEAIVSDLAIVPFRTVAQTAQVLDILGGPSSPLRALLEIVRDNTALHTPPAPEATAAAPQEGLSDRLKRLPQILRGTQPAEATVSAVAPGALITAHFTEIHRLFAGEPGAAPIDRLEAKFKELSQKLQEMGDQVGGESLAKAVNDRAVSALIRAVGDEAQSFPPEIRTLVEDVRRLAEGNLSDGGRDWLTSQYRQRVLAECQQYVPNRYPFVREGASELPLADFSRLFGTGGVYHRFFQDHLADMVDTSTRPWSWRRGAVLSSSQILARFEAAESIRHIFFGNDASPRLQFTVTMAELDESTTRFRLILDGTVFDYQRGARLAVTWPGPTPGAAAAFEDRTGQTSGPSHEGSWAVFRLFDVGEPRQESSTRTALTFRGRHHVVRLLVDADSLRNPFGQQDWRSFRCGS